MSRLPPARSSPFPSLLPSAIPKEPTQVPQPTHVPSPPTQPPASPSSHPNSTFSPFFTLVENVHTAEHHHPAVHYIFSDDDNDLITDAALRIHDTNLQLQAPPPTKPNSPNPTPSGSTSPLPPHDRYILLTLSPSLATISSARSMTSDWQVLSAEITSAPTLEGANGEEGKSMMLRIEGTEGAKRLGREEGEALSLEGLVEEFGRRMEELRRVVGAGEKEGEGD